MSAYVRIAQHQPLYATASLTLIAFGLYWLYATAEAMVSGPDAALAVISSLITLGIFGAAAFMASAVILSLIGPWLIGRWHYDGPGVGLILMFFLSVACFITGLIGIVTGAQWLPQCSLIAASVGIAHVFAVWFWSTASLPATA